VKLFGSPGEGTAYAEWVVQQICSVHDQEQGEQETRVEALLDTLDPELCRFVLQRIDEVDAAGEVSQQA